MIRRLLGTSVLGDPSENLIKKYEFKKTSNAAKPNRAERKQPGVFRAI